MIRHYELTVVLSPELSTADLDATTKAITDLVGSLQGKVGAVDDWGEKRMVYAIKKHDRAVYKNLSLELDSEQVAELETRIRRIDGVLRWLVVSREE